MKIPTDWTFKNKEIADNFDFHVRQQLPWYDLATGLISHCIRHYLPENGLIYDIGCSTGNLELSIDDILKKRNATMVPIDNSDEMRQMYRGNSQVVIADAHSFDYQDYDVAVCFLTLMFLGVSERAELIKKLQQKIKNGGCLIVFDKTITEDGYLSTVLHRATIAGKIASGAESSEVIAKELSLGGIQRPLSARFIRYNMITAVEIFRFGEFAGWILEAKE